MRGQARIAFAAAFAAVVSIGLTSCATSKDAPTNGARAADSGRTPVYRIAQLSFGGNAAFGVCMEPACPSVTRKTIAARQALQPRRAEPAATAASAVVEPPRPAVPQPPATPSAQALPSSVVVAKGLSTEHLTVTFTPGSSELGAAARSALRAAMTDARRAERIVISGRTDSTGEPGSNEALALARAVSVRDFIREQAPELSDRSIEIHSKGRCCFVASNETEEGRSKNRRVGVFFVSREGA